MRLPNFAGSVVAALMLVVACGGSSADVAGGGGGDGGTSGTSGGPVSEGGASTDGSTPTVDGSTPAEGGASAGCKIDADCNEEAGAAMAGTCFVTGGVGACICKVGFHVEIDGKCGRSVLPDCATQGGQCVQGAATCAAGDFQGSAEDDRTCGDLIAAACCFDTSKCKGPAFGCCGPQGQATKQICESGHLTCQPGDHAVATGTVCG